MRNVVVTPKLRHFQPPSAFQRTLFLALERAGALLLRNFDRPNKISFKGGSFINLVTPVDRRADALIRRTILRAFPDHDMLTEESTSRSVRSPYKWIVDPLDGTTNYAHHFPQCGVSIGLAFNGRIILGGVFDPFRDELFWAAKGAGAWMRRGGRAKRITVSSTRQLARSLLLTGFPYDRRHKADLYLSYIKAFMQRIQGIRRAGAAALDMCWVACGRVDGYWEWRLKPWDSAAGTIIVEEAGGRLSDFSGERHSIYGAQTLATNSRIHDEMVRVMRRIERPAG
ncbi:MAG TPA: inositol monophosphatase family protein [Elusimicrobiota bacterium]|nr:inositol monophosphatase family protein [Elusimicrobiota bacterium]